METTADPCFFPLNAVCVWRACWLYTGLYWQILWPYPRKRELDERIFSSLNYAGQGFTQALGYWEVVLNTNNWGYWPDIWLSGSTGKQRTTDCAELGVLDAGPMTAILQHIKVLSPTIV
jgi:hypothetical protein